MPIDARTTLGALRGLIEVHTRALEEDLPGALQRVVDALADVLDVRGVAINLRRPAWDDFEIVAIHAPAEIIERLRGGRVPLSTVERLMDPKYDVGGAFFIPAGEIDEAELGGVSAIIQRDDRPDHPDRWQEDDELLVPIRSAAGRLIGFLSVDEPVSGLRPGPEQIEIAVAVAAAAASSVLGAQRALEARRNRQTVELLFELSTKLISSSDIDEVLRACCEGINRALGFERIVIEMVDTATGRLRHAAALGWDELPEPNEVRDIEALCQPEYEVEGCYLLTDEDALAIVGEQARRFLSTRNGRGSAAWDHHWLVVPLRDAEGALVGWVWPDDPADHLIPSPDALRILRTFANQALAAVTDASHVEQLQELARLDDLTGAHNRRAFFERLDEELVRTHRTNEVVTLVLFDLDNFKAINDRFGHPAGDAALRTFVRILERNIRSTDVVGRVGGDEFALVLSGATPEDAERVLGRIHETLDHDASTLATVRASHGVARAPDDGSTRDQLVQVADERLYDMKRRRNHPPIALVADDRA